MEEIDPLAANKKLADILLLIGNYYVMGGDGYRAKSFINAGKNISNYPIVIMTGAQARKDLTGIGNSIEAAIDEYFATGTITRLQELEEKFSDRKSAIDLFKSFYGIGPVTAFKFYNQGFRTLEDLWYKANLTQAQKLGIVWRDHMALRIDRNEMHVINERIATLLNPYQIRWSIAGSYRRGELSSGDIDVLVQSRPDLNMDGLVYLLQPILAAKLAMGEHLYMGIVRIDDQHNGHRIDIRLVDSVSYPYALMYFTGSQQFNILMRRRAIELGMTLNEYGLFYANTDTFVQQNVTTEEEIFNLLRVTYMAPVERIRGLSQLRFI